MRESWTSFIPGKGGLPGYITAIMIVVLSNPLLKVCSPATGLGGPRYNWVKFMSLESPACQKKLYSVFSLRL